jgi:hypothetical protein
MAAQFCGRCNPVANIDASVAEGSKDLMERIKDELPDWLRDQLPRADAAARRRGRRAAGILVG